MPQALTLEHVPPEALGGGDRGRILLCGVCNHTSGTKLDRQIQIKLDVDDFKNMVPGSSVEGRYYVGLNAPSVATLSISDDGHLVIKGDLRRSNPALKAKELEYLSSASSLEQFSGGFSFSSGKIEFANVGLLRIAYLLAFRTFGYSYIFHPYLQQIRDQILRPEESILPPYTIVAVFCIKIVSLRQ
ncbi:MAG: HNH endonuclease [Blastochloris sp.]|nr:HNH endonuclease [Blastochloris sp.]